MYDCHMSDLPGLNPYLLRGYEDIFRRLTLLEHRNRLTPLDFGILPLPEDDADRVKALCALARWRVERLEALLSQ
jgi:hypothetical protein